MHYPTKRSYAYVLLPLAGAMLTGIIYILYKKRTEGPVPTEDDPYPLSRNIPADNDARLETKIEHAVQAMGQVNDETEHEGSNAAEQGSDV